MSTRREKVFGGHYAGKRRIVVRASSQKQAVERLCAAGYRIPLNELRKFWSETGNLDEIAAAERSKNFVAISPIK